MTSKRRKPPRRKPASESVRPAAPPPAIASDRRVSLALAVLLAAATAIAYAPVRQLDFVDLAKIDLDETAVDTIPEAVARRVKAIGYGFANSVLLVAVADPTDDRGLDEVRESTGRRVRFKVALASEIESALYDAYGEPLVTPA